ncbi:MAG: 2-hydroxychromene-2-carboxylate isomerase [Myxococcales bacterium]|nr:2-hydroxychromene-2-carboxylate isomerase [Myxococcales bacterium]
MPGAIRCFFDFLSPYAYLGFSRVQAIAARHARDVEPVPVLFAALLKAHGTRGPAEVPARRRYLMKDVVRLAHDYQMPLDAPFAHPFNPLLMLRVSSLPMDNRERVRLVAALYRATWAERRNVVEASVVGEVLGVMGFPSDWLDLASQPEAKERVRYQTDEAVRLGVFGVPSFVVDGELFWGCDSLPHLDRFLAGADPVPRDLLARWEELPVQATRREA